MEISVILNFLFGGGFVAAIVGLFTLRSTIHKASAEADTVKIQNTETATRILVQNIVDPLQEELKETREELKETKKEFSSTKREMARLRKALGEANTCKHTEECPVLTRLRDGQKCEELSETEKNNETCETLST